MKCSSEERQKGGLTQNSDGYEQRRVERAGRRRMMKCKSEEGGNGRVDAE